MKPAAASIRPRLLARGDHVRAAYRLFQIAASIRPRLLARGDLTQPSSLHPSPKSFNSATPACAWRHDASSILAILAIRLQFGHACLRVETTHKVFATPDASTASIRPRLLARGDVLGTAVAVFTVPALQFGHACLRVETVPNADGAGVARECFNSATPACAWRQLHARPSRPGRLASIRPRLLARGDVS